MPHDHIRLNAKGGEQAHHGNIGRQYGGLGHFRLFNSGFALGNLFFAFARFAPQGFRQRLADNVG